MMLRVAGGLLAALAAVLVVIVLGAVASLLADRGAGDAVILLSMILGAASRSAAALVVAAGLLAAVLALLFGVGAAPLWRGGVRAVALGAAVAVALCAGGVLGWAALTPGWPEQVAHTRWWLSDRTPPAIDISAPGLPVRGPATIRVSTADDGEHRLTWMAVDGVAVQAAAEVIIDTSTMADGEHIVVVEAQDESRQENRAQASITFRSETRWWMNDTTPPLITVTAPAAVAQGVIPVALATSDEGEHHLTLLTLDGVALPVVLPISSVIRIDTAALLDGSHTIAAEAEDASRQRNRAQVTATFQSDNNPPTLSVQLDPPIATQGHAQSIRISASEVVTAVVATLGGSPLTLAQSQTGFYWAVLGYDPDAAPGASLLKVVADDLVGHAGQVTASVVMTRFDFPLELLKGETIEMPAGKAELYNYSDADNKILAKLYARLTPAPLWEGAFIVPVTGQQTSAFYIRRQYNGGPAGVPHTGVDIAASEGTPVKADAAGRVVFAEALKSKGNVVVVDHGMGVFTAYFHLSEIRVKVEEMVDKGQVIGLVGTTGISTGPHLHWEMRVTGNPIDPWTWTQRLFP